MQKEIKGFMEYVQQEFASQSPQFQARKENALVRTMPLNIVRINRKLS
jgi:hypothetical protein